MKKKRPKTQATDEELLPWMDYLHGDVVDDQFRAACQYEYARESTVLRKAAEIFAKNPTPNAGEVFLQVEREFPSAAGNWLIHHEWSFISRCGSFPVKGWNQLAEQERAELLYALPASTTKVRPLQLGEVTFLTRCLDQLKEMAAQGHAELKKQLAAEARAGKARAQGKKNVLAVRRRKKVYPILELPNTPFVQALLPLDFRKSKKRLLQEIDKWLELPEQKARFDKHKQRTEAGTEQEAQDRLKDLAAWRLYRELGCDETLRLTEKKRKRDNSGVPRPFHDPRQDQTKKVPLNEAPLYSEESGFLKAKKRAEDHLAELIPWEFGKYAEEREQQKREWAATFKKVLKEAKKISKSSS